LCPPILSLAGYIYHVPGKFDPSKTWLRNCLRNHKPCGTYPPSCLLPRRVIDVTNLQAPFLYLGNGQHGQYVTLSYKWGDSRKYAVSVNNYQQHLRGIPFQELPWTFREAVQVTNSLGFCYLWIDALCILQDSKDDLQREIGSMYQIYRNSTLTIFAAGGDNADTRLSFSRDPRWNKPCKLDLKTTAGGQRSQGSLYVTLGQIGDEDGPLYQRGWVLQEEILSTRALVFGSRQISWRCLCGEASEERPGYNSVQTVDDLGAPQHNK
jgi:Heterokaryon incompatibility protein (HET)